MEQDVLNEEFPRCERAGVGVVVGGVFNSGITATGPIPGAKYNYSDATPEQMDRVAKIMAVCAATTCASGGGAAIPARSSDRRIDHPRRNQPGPGPAERRLLPPFDSGVALVGPEERRPDLA